MVKMFYFKTSGYGEEAHVMAETKDQAIEFLTASAKKMDKEWDNSSPPSMYDYRTKLAVQMANSQDGYTIEEHGIGDVIWTEIS